MKDDKIAVLPINEGILALTMDDADLLLQLFGFRYFASSISYSNSRKEEISKITSIYRDLGNNFLFVEIYPVNFMLEELFIDARLIKRYGLLYEDHSGGFLEIDLNEYVKLVPKTKMDFKKTVKRLRNILLHELEEIERMRENYQFD